MPTPGDGETGSVLTAIAVRGDLGFAVGRRYPQGSGAFTPLLYRFDGASWTGQSLPSLPASATEPVLMSATISPTTPGTGWITGYVNVPAPTHNLPLIACWRNNSFDRVELPTLRRQTVYPFDPRGGFGYDTVAISDNDVWVVGQATGFGDAQATSVPMALHWDGSTWQDVPTRIVANRSHRFDAVSASSSANVWAVGASRTIADPFRGLIQRWDGSQWQVVAHPALSIEQSQFHDVLALSPTEVWVAGAINYTDPLLYRWNGSSWDSMPIPGGSGSAVVAITGTDPNHIWAVTSGTVATTFLWDGDSWNEVANPVPPTGVVDSARAIAADGPCDAWVAGTQMDASGFRGTFIERLEPTAPVATADFNADGFVTSTDFFDFIGAFLASSTDADINQDAVLDSLDFFAYLALFLGQ